MHFIRFELRFHQLRIFEMIRASGIAKSSQGLFRVHPQVQDIWWLSEKNLRDFSRFLPKLDCWRSHFPPWWLELWFAQRFRDNLKIWCSDTPFFPVFWSLCMFLPCFSRENIGHLLLWQAMPAAPAAMTSDASTAARNCVERLWGSDLELVVSIFPVYSLLNGEPRSYLEFHNHLILDYIWPSCT